MEGNENLRIKYSQHFDGCATWSLSLTIFAGPFPITVRSTRFSPFDKGCFTSRPPYWSMLKNPGSENQKASRSRNLPLVYSDDVRTWETLPTTTHS